jgi:hypothetical protein
VQDVIATDGSQDKERINRIETEELNKQKKSIKSQKRNI